MKALFSFEGGLGRAGYAWRVAAAMAVQYAYIFAVTHGATKTPATSPFFWLDPFLAFRDARLSINAAMGAWVVILAVDWMLVASTYRRARTLNQPAGWSAFTLIPAIQVFVLIALAIVPPLPGEDPVDQPAPPKREKSYLQGLLCGVAICVGSVVVSSLLFHDYGGTLFFFAPFVVGLTTGYIANRHDTLSMGANNLLVLTAIGLGALALLGFAIEGAICLILAAPIIVAMALLGGVLGRALAIDRRGPGATMMSVAVMPMMFAAEYVVPPHAHFDSAESIDIAAPASAVWDSVVHMGPIPGAPRAPFRWGLAYPVRGQIIGSGVGAIRRGVFSTGTAYERVTEWAPDHKLSFAVLSDPPTMRELTPYGHANPPHLNGYFRTRDALFTIVPLVNGKTRLTLTTHHDLDLAPALYWMPIAQWAVHENKIRVMAHFRDQAESIRR